MNGNREGHSKNFLDAATKLAERNKEEDERAKKRLEDLATGVEGLIQHPLVTIANFFNQWIDARPASEQNHHIPEAEQHREPHAPRRDLIFSAPRQLRQAMPAQHPAPEAHTIRGRLRAKLHGLHGLHGG